MPRYNKCSNPYWTSGSASTGITNSAAAGPYTRAFWDQTTTVPRGDGWQFAANSTSKMAPYNAGQSIANQTWTVSCWLRRNSGGSATTATHTIAIEWLNSSGGTLSTSSTASFSVPGVDTAANTRNGVRATRTVTAPANAFGLRLVTGTTSTASSWQATAVLYEQASSAGTYFDGKGDNTPAPDFGVNNGQYFWDGTANASTSTFQDATGTVDPAQNDNPNPKLAGDASGWSIFTGGTGQRVTGINDHVAATTAYRVTSDMIDQSVVTNLPTINIQGRATLAVSIDVEKITSTTNTATAYIVWLNASGQQIGVVASSGVSLANTTQWFTCAIPATNIPVDAVFAQVRLGITGSTLTTYQANITQGIYTVNGVNFIPKNGSDSLVMMDTGTVNAFINDTDSATHTDSATLATSQTRNDTFTLTEGTPQIAQTVSDTHSLTVENAVILQLLYAQGDDTATQLDNATIAATMTLSDTLTHIDTASVSATMTVSDTAIQSDSAAISFDVSDSAAQTDNASISQSVDDQAVQTDDATIQFPTGISDSATHTDNASIGQSVSDSATQTEGPTQIGQTVSETHTLSDTARIHLNTGISDTHTLTDNASTNRFASDTHNLTSEVASIGPVAFDSATLSDNATVFVWANGHDSAVFFDTVSNIRAREPIFDDQIKYAPARAKSRKPFRVLAQNIFTKEWVHNDLPLSDELITTRVSGPGSFKGVFNTEIRQLLDLQPGLIPGATWLHVEEEGDIRQSTILQPWIDSNGDQRRQVEGVGFSSYLNQVFYQGEEYKKIQIDPADIIRYIWSHAQSFPTGNLGIVVAGTKTPVKLGTEPKKVEFEDGQTGEEVAFESGPYDLNWWEVTNLGTEFEKLCKETPIEYFERSYWNPGRTDVLHRLELGYPRVGAKRDPSELIIREGENLKQLIPEYSEDASLFPSDVIIVGAGEGPTAIRGYASQITGRLRHTVVLENEDITSKARADAIAKFELNRRTKSRYSIKRVSIDTTHINTPWGSFVAGDDVQVEGEISYVGKIQDFHRIIEIAYSPRTRIADCSLSPSSSFSYGAVPEVEQ